MPGHEAHIGTLVDHPDAIIPDTIARNTGVDTRIATHAGVAAAHHAVHVGTVGDHPESIIPVAIARLTEVDSRIAARATSGTAAGRPAAGVSGRYYIATDTRMLSFDNGTAWIDIANIVGTEVDSRIATHSGVTTGIHGVGTSTVESVAGAQAKADTRLHNDGGDTLRGGLAVISLPAPTAPIVEVIGAVGTTGYSYCVTARSRIGETARSTDTVITNGNATLSGTNFNRISWTAVPGAVNYRVWRTFSGGTPATTGAIATVTTLTVDDTGLVAAGTAPISDTSGRIGIGTSAPHTSAILDLTSTTQGMLLPRMTTAQRDAITAPSDGLVIYNTTVAAVQERHAGAWITPETVSGAQAKVDAHAGLTTAHSAVSAATASRIMMRDAAGRAQVIDGAAAADISTRGQLDTHAGLPAVHHAIDAMVIVTQPAEPAVPAGLFRVWHNTTAGAVRRWLVLGTDGTVAGNRKVEMT